MEDYKVLVIQSPTALTEMNIHAAINAAIDRNAVITKTARPETVTVDDVIIEYILRRDQRKALIRDRNNRIDYHVQLNNVQAFNETYNRASTDISDNAEVRLNELLKIHEVAPIEVITEEATDESNATE